MQAQLLHTVKCAPTRMDIGNTSEYILLFTWEEGVRQWEENEANMMYIFLENK